MPDIALANVTYTQVEGSQKASPSEPRRSAVYQIAFGNGALTYPTGGVPLDKGKLGCPTQIDEFIVMDAGANGFIYKYDSANNKLRIYQGDNDAVADGALVELGGGVATPVAATLKAKVVGW